MVAINKGWKPCFEELEPKPLSGGLKYAYLGPGKLKPKWDGPFIVREGFNHEAVVVEDPRDGRILKVNGQRLKPYLGGVIPEEETMSMEIPTYWDAR